MQGSQEPLWPAVATCSDAANVGAPPLVPWTILAQTVAAEHGEGSIVDLDKHDQEQPDPRDP